MSHAPILRRPIKKNIDALKKIRKSSECKTYLVSSRFGFLKDRTEKLLDRNKLRKYFDGVYFNYENNQPHVFKENTIKKLNIDTYIDDDIDLAMYLANKIPSLNVYWLKNGRKGNVSLPDNVIPIKTLNEFFAKISKI